jgi:DUF1365 family protein
VNRFNLVSFHERDHGPCDGTPLRAHVEAQLAARGVAGPLGRILLLAYPRCLNVVFNPLAIYYAFDRQERLAGVIYEVRNTFGERHSYVLPVTPAPSLRRASGRAPARRSTFRPSSPWTALTISAWHQRGGPALRILESDREGPLLSTGFTGRPRDLTSFTALAAFGLVPLMTLKVVAGIHWEALQLWLKGLKPLPRPIVASATSKAAAPPVRA